ncbi:MAG: hypothetical protein K0U74_08775 [Alphaproteobacteria bacterium]|nr:hypothetical protein [Alphaproteobacteria bacterium]
MGRLVIIRHFYTLPDALVARSVLDAYGIVATLPDFNLVSNAWLWTQAVQGIRLGVVDLDEPVAMGLLEPVERVRSGHIPIGLDNLIWAAFALFFAGVPHPVRRGQTICGRPRTSYPSGSMG